MEGTRRRRTRKAVWDPIEYEDTRPQCGDPNRGVGTQTPGLGPHTLETAVSGRYAEYYGGGARERCATVRRFKFMRVLV